MADIFVIFRNPFRCEKLWSRTWTWDPLHTTFLILFESTAHLFLCFVFCAVSWILSQKYC